MDKQELKDRLAGLEQAVLVSKGRVAQAQTAVDDEQAGAFQIEGRLLEVTEILEAMTDDEKDE